MPKAASLAWSYSGGGVSEYFTRPSWQIGTGMPGGTMRAVPDVACPADPNNGAVLFYNGAQTVVGGTSWSSPTWAGYCALINQARSNAGGVSGAQYALRRLVTHGPSGGLNCGNAGSLVAALLGVAMGRAFDQRLCPIFGGRLYLERIDHCFARHAFTIWKEIADALEYTLVMQMGISFSIPVLVWIAVLFRRQDVKTFALT
ncbi:MAG TPA: hypothetical protein VGX93_00095 [Chthoniobacterales bacterium]|nr:hypothetical protein [Chthoniobacterales bacterium]